MSGPELVKLIIKVILSQQEGAENYKEEEKLESDVLVRCFCIGVSLLNMEYELTEKLQHNKAKSTVTATQHEEVVDAIFASLHQLLVALWSALIRAQTLDWLEFSARHVGTQEEEFMKANFLLYSAIVGLLRGRIKGMLLPTPSEGKELLDAVIESSKIAQVTWNRVNNEWKQGGRMKVCIDVALSKK